MNLITVLLAILLIAAIIFIFILKSHNIRLEERLRVAGDNLARQRADFDRINADAERRFAAMADKSLADNAESLRRQNHAGLEEVLAPMKEDIDNFRRTVNDIYSREARERFALGERVRELIDLNRIIGNETRRLRDALQGNSRIQGDWGEMILDNILQRAGLRRGYEYQVQQSVADSNGRRLRPDVIISYTEGRKIVIDSKVSLTSYLDMLGADDEKQRSSAAALHVASVRKHVAELRGKSYHEVLGSDVRLDYVLMFIPNEGAFLAAMALDPKLWETAFDAGVLIISPAHLMSIVKLIEQMWRHDKQNRNAVAIAEEAGRMLDKFRGFLDDMEKIDKSLTTAHQSWNDAFRKLTAGPGNLVSRAEKLALMGAKAKKGLRKGAEPDDMPVDASAVSSVADDDVGNS